jgi:structural maintenance of chromosome 3 (chondroitin sulfate proteoglycan 6)
MKCIYHRLFFHIVETDQVGTQILKEMNRQKLPGEANFMPLNKLLAKAIDYPQTQVRFNFVMCC